MRRKTVSILLIVFGLMVMSTGLLFHASNAIPYQDATPELLATQAAAARQWGAVIALGAIATVAGIVLWWQLRRADRDSASTRSR